MRTILATGAMLIAFSATAFGADMIEYGGSQATVTTTYRTAYYREEVCNDLVLVYRPPHVPQRDYVRVCHRPMPGE